MYESKWRIREKKSFNCFRKFKKRGEKCLVFVAGFIVEIFKFDNWEEVEH